MSSIHWHIHWPSLPTPERYGYALYAQAFQESLRMTNDPENTDGPYRVVPCHSIECDPRTIPPWVLECP